MVLNEVTQVVQRFSIALCIRPNWADVFLTVLSAPKMH